MKSLLNAQDRQAVLARLGAFDPGARRRWGRMSVGGMLCHLSDAFSLALGDRDGGRTPRLHERTVMRWIGVSTPLPWPKGLPTAPACDQEVGGTPPTDFSGDKATLLKIIDRFLSQAETGSMVHPLFGPMSAAEWGRWGYRHIDHHLRQFGA